MFISVMLVQLYVYTSYALILSENLNYFDIFHLLLTLNIIVADVILLTERVILNYYHSKFSESFTRK